METSKAVGAPPTMKDLEIRLAQLKVPDPLPAPPTSQIKVGGTKLDSDDDGDDDDLEDEDQVEEYVSREKNAIEPKPLHQEPLYVTKQRGSSVTFKTKFH